MMDANQKWDVNDAISWMKELAEFKPLWIEEPTSPDDVLGHAAVAKVPSFDTLKEFFLEVNFLVDPSLIFLE